MNISVEEFRAQVAGKPKRSKYGNQKTVVDGITFDSKLEARYYSNLKLREKAGEVYGVELQRPFVLTINGFLVGTYKADFCFWDSVEDRFRVVDIKGVSTPVFKLKAKMVKALYGFNVETVK